MIQDKTYKVQVWDHNDAVVFVYENIYKKVKNPKDPETKIYKTHKNVITAIPVHFGYGDDLTNEDKVKLVEKVASSLEDMYSYDCDGHEIGISYYINTHQYVNA